jgi:hypothetical protein
MKWKCPNCKECSEIPSVVVAAAYASQQGAMGGRSGTGESKRRSDEHYLHMRDAKEKKKAKAKAFRVQIGLAT